jgi:hypothetical protein
MHTSHAAKSNLASDTLGSTDVPDEPLSGNDVSTFTSLMALLNSGSEYSFKYNAWQIRQLLLMPGSMIERNVNAHLEN